MSREVRFGASGGFEIRFPFDRSLVDTIKTLPSRRWNAAERYWWVPENLVVELVDLLQPCRFRFDEETRRRYIDNGGTAQIPEEAPGTPADGLLPGLFDDSSVPANTNERDPAADLSVTELNQRVKLALERAFPTSIWLVGEISGFNRNAHKRHVSFQIVEREDNGKTVSSVDATLFERSRKELLRVLRNAGSPFEVEDEITVRLKVRIELYVPWGSYRVLVEDIDVSYTLGEAARRREEIVRRLGQEGLLERNRSLPLAAVPLRVGLITSLGSDAYNDVLRTLQESAFAFRVLAHGARVQGHSTEPSVLNALDRFRERAADLDVILICRGGGSRTDLAWFDSEALGRAVAHHPLPIVIGIGHEQDQSVLDSLARRAKTPTAAAALLVQRIQESLAALDQNVLAILERVVLVTAGERQRGLERGRRLSIASRALLDRQRSELDHRRRRTVRASNNLILRSSERLQRWVRTLPRASAVLLAGIRRDLSHTRRGIAQATGRDLSSEGERIAMLAEALSPRVRRIVLQERERVGVRDRRLALVDPRRVLDRGYAILRREHGPVLTDADDAPAGSAWVAQLRRGELRIRSEGRLGREEGES